MSMIAKEEILQELLKISANGHYLSEDIISGIIIKNDQVGFVIELGNLSVNQDELTKICEQTLLKKFPGLNKVVVVYTNLAQPQQSMVKKTRAVRQPIKGVKRIIPIIAGKGGVGKSTIATNLAISSQKLGLKVGLVDADIYGPSIPKMMGIKEKPEMHDNMVEPVIVHDIKTMSIGYLLPDESATIWRGPMLTKMLYQLLQQVNWGELDVLFIDMPPGTGDIALSLTEHYDLTGAVIVTTPQEIAVLDVRKAINMLQKMQIPILGVIENMSHFIDSANQKHYVFGKDGGKRLAAEFNLSFLGEIPLDMQIREYADAGKSIADSQGLHSNFKAIAQKIF